MLREHTAPINPAGEALAWPMRLNQYEKRKARPSLPSPPCPVRPSAPFPSFFPQRNCSIQYRANLAKGRAHLA